MQVNAYLINNSVKAGARRVVVSTAVVDKNTCFVKIQDDGCGLPDVPPESLGSRGFSVGKTGGSGLGLYHARQSLSAWNGTLTLQPAPKRGAHVGVTLPRAPAPPYFALEISLASDAEVVILDNDISIHKVWATRFSKIKKCGRDWVLRDFSRADDLTTWWKHQTPRPSLFLCDQELIGQNRTGIQVIRELGISEHAILVTNMYEDNDLRNECQKFGVKMFPKPFAGVVPISVRAL